MKPQELRELADEELKAKLAEITEERFRLRFRSATEDVGNTARFQLMRRDIARIRTILRERQK